MRGFAACKRAAFGFTLIELLVAVSILIILTTIALTTYSSSQKSARDAKRRSDIKTIAAAIEASKNSETGKYKFTTTDLSNEFSNDSNASTGTDPSGVVYCINRANSSTAPPSTPNFTAANWCDNVVVTGWYPLTTWFNATSPGTDFTNGLVTAWTICTFLESNSEVFCMSSLTQ